VHQTRVATWLNRMCYNKIELGENSIVEPDMEPVVACNQEPEFMKPGREKMKNMLIITITDNNDNNAPEMPDKIDGQHVSHESRESVKTSTKIDGMYQCGVSNE
jgi:hypothetical protein